MDPEPPLNVIAPDRSIVAHLRAIWQYRELLGELIRKELKVKYQDSSLGFAWSMLNPAMYLAVYYVVFKIILASGIPAFAIYLMSGLLLWNFFSTAVSNAVNVIVSNGSLVNKVYFPREILPLASVGANLVHFFLQLIVLVVALAIFRHPIDWGYLWLTPIALLTVVMLASALAVFLSATNVYARDLQHLLELVLLAWFWMTPIIYPWGLVAGELQDRDLPTELILVNPVVGAVMTFQRALYATVTYGDPPNTILPGGDQLWYLRNLLIVLAIATVLFAFAVKVFGRLEASFAEEL